ncbi:MAG: MFS transporter [Agitococcus sp.]|nr:MFS transporter [Agitococcus sp.]
MKSTIAKSNQEASESVSPISIRWILTSLSLTMLLSSLGTSIANVGLPTLTKAFNASFQEVQWVVIAYLLAITTLIVSVGRLGDLMGRRRLMLAGLFLFTFASTVCAIAPTLSTLIGSRALQGLGAAIMMSLTMAFVGDAVPKEKTGSAMGLLGTMSAIGTALGPSLGGLLIAGLGWRSIFFINVPLGLFALLLAYRYLPVDRQLPQVNRPRFDHLGTLLLALTLGAYALAMTIGHGNFGTINFVLLVVATVGVALFTLTEAKVKSPLIRLEIFKNPVLSTGFVTSTLVATVMMATLVVGPFYLSGALALDAASVGLVMAAGPVVAAMTGVPVGRFVDRFGSQRMTIIGLLGMAVGTFILTIVPTRFGVVGYVLPLILITFSYAIFQVSNNTSVMANIGSEQRGVISGMLNLSRNLGLITGASVMGAIFTFGSATANITMAHPSAVAAGMRMTFSVAVLLMVSAIIITMTSNAIARRVLSANS